MIHFKYKKNRVMTHVVDGYDVTVPVPKTVGMVRCLAKLYQIFHISLH